MADNQEDMPQVGQEAEGQGLSHWNAKGPQGEDVGDLE